MSEISAAGTVAPAPVKKTLSDHQPVALPSKTIGNGDNDTQ